MCHKVSLTSRELSSVDTVFFKLDIRYSQKIAEGRKEKKNCKSLSTSFDGGSLQLV